jgi:transcription initiation factor TFIID subunit 13
VAQLLYGHGDVKHPLPETVRVLDEMVTDFIQGVSFEATRAAHHAGRQKVKFEDFEFAMRKNPLFTGKVQEVFEKKREIDRARNIMNDDDQIIRDANRAEKEAALKEKKRAAGAAGADGADAAASSINGHAEAGDDAMGESQVNGGTQEEALGEADDDADAEADALGRRR